ncbi:Glutathione S-transferase omega-like protein [Hapsidospora chrysogenum ATCC 11550]|uniref:Glutathione S-transferase omega-like protein n=1 Tax=Hapsidospora chrysogenum (strain ATCC 11550 / CBS 779.69 / DSM 880 / IAM 14645 / JCM 23072 / IMI 49137) TaxID=857340 RepID=A0A086T429_HAPC1|nr:Glutathione S-transferase omega-like protein [Hapsidospora chrysogenum ATCC 11550]
MATAATPPPIALYTNHGCPFAHRAHVALAELKIPFEERIVDLGVPRTPEYLAINPRGLVPSLVHGDDIITESAVVANFLADAYPSHLIPASSDPKGPLTRARVAFFADTFSSKLVAPLFKGVFAPSDEEGSKTFNELVDVLVKEVEPLLADAAPFFGGSAKLTMAEVLTGPFVIRLLTWPNHGLAPKTVLADLEARAPNFFRWAQKVAAHPSVRSIYDEETIAQAMKEKRDKTRA